MRVEGVASRHSKMIQNPAPKNRSTLRSKDPLITDENKAVRQRSTEIAEIRRKAPKEHRRTQGWLRQVAVPGEASGDARLASPGRSARRSIRGRKAAFGRRRSESQSPSVASSDSRPRNR
ncbi:hypothetical protein RJ60_03920 [Mesotoga sp. B105.6.4]|nr:hypothetical protein RJ60_03920 [Mesotoga sp. B105.6.4]